MYSKLTPVQDELSGKSNLANTGIGFVSAY